MYEWQLVVVFCLFWHLLTSHCAHNIDSALNQHCFNVWTSNQCWFHVDLTLCACWGHYVNKLLVTLLITGTTSILLGGLQQSNTIGSTLIKSHGIIDFMFFNIDKFIYKLFMPMLSEDYMHMRKYSLYNKNKLTLAK